VSPTDYDKEVQAVMADLDHAGGIERHKEYLKYYVNEAYNEEVWPLTWEGFKHDFAISVVEIRRMGSRIDLSDGAELSDETLNDTNREGQPEFNGAFGIIDA
jgi:hypothetical protein